MPSSRLVCSLQLNTHSCNNAKKAISTQITKSLRPVVVRSGDWCAKRRVTTPKETNRDMTMDCQKQKKTMSLTAINLSKGLARCSGSQGNVA